MGVMRYRYVDVVTSTTISPVTGRDLARSQR